MSAYRGIYAVVDRATTADPEALLHAFLRAGITLVQYRAKAGVDRTLVRALHARTRAAGARLIVNDDFEAALEADGWHAGQEDLAERDARECRRVLGARIFGVSCGAPAEARVAEAFGADYVGTGPFALTGSKADAGAAIGAAGVRAVVDATRLPVVAIGGITLDDLPAVAASGAAMAAMISALCAGPDPEAAACAAISVWSGASSANASRARRDVASR